MTRRTVLAWVPLLAGCNARHEGARIARIQVARDGTVTLNGQTVTIEQLRASLTKLSQSPGAAVWYYREDPGGRPHPNVMLVLQAMTATRLPVRLSTKPDFSDSIGPNGTPIAR